MINAARRVWFLVSGAEKAGMVAEVLEGLRVPKAVPAQGVVPVHGTLTWLLDEAAAAELSPERPRLSIGRRAHGAGSTGIARDRTRPRGGADGRFMVSDADGRPVCYTPDDFDEIYLTTDEHEAGRHVEIGWLLLDEVVGKGHGPDRIEFVKRMVSSGGDGGPSLRTVPINVGPDDETTYVLGYLKPGRVGHPS